MKTLEGKPIFGKPASHPVTRLAGGAVRGAERNSRLVL